MAVKLFVIGPPASGKSTVCRYINEYLAQEHRNWLATHFDDYRILSLMSEEYPELFGLSEQGTFHVENPIAYDRALKQVEGDVKKRIQFISDTKNELTLIEFARMDYYHGFRQFNRQFVKNAYFIFLDVDIKICKKRNLKYRRVAASHQNYSRVSILPSTTETLDKHVVPEKLLDDYFDANSQEYVYGDFRHHYNIADDHIIIIKNSGDLVNIIEQLNSFVNSIIEQQKVTDAQLVKQKTRFDLFPQLSASLSMSFITALFCFWLSFYDWNLLCVS